MKNLANILRKSNLSPKERIITIIQNEIYKDKNGKGILSESELYSLTEGWKPKDSYEVKEYNRYLKAFELEKSMRLDARMFAYRSENFLLRSHILIDYTMYLENTLEDFKKNETVNRYVPQEEIINFIAKNTYIGYEKLVHIFTFNKLPKNIRDDLILLDEYASYDSRYLEDEVFLFNMFKELKPLSTQNKDILVEHIFSRMYHEGFRKIKNGSEKDGFLLHHFFAELPLVKVFEKWAEYAHINLDEQNISNENYLLNKFEEYSKDKNQTMEMVVKDILSRWIDDGLFVSEYTPLFFSNRNNTWNGNTKLTHKEIFIKWYTELQKTETFMNRLVSGGDIEIKFIDKEILDTTEKVKVVTGQSIYKCKADIDFVKECKDQMLVLAPIAGLFLFIKKNNNPLVGYITLKSFCDLAQIFSDIFDIDMTEKYSDSLHSFEQEMAMVNINFNKLFDKVNELLYTNDKIRYVLEVKEDNLYFDLNGKSSESADEIIDDYKNELKKMGFRTDSLEGSSG